MRSNFSLFHKHIRLRVVAAVSCHAIRRRFKVSDDEDDPRSKKTKVAISSRLTKTTTKTTDVLVNGERISMTTTTTTTKQKTNKNDNDNDDDSSSSSDSDTARIRPKADEDAQIGVSVWEQVRREWTRRPLDGQTTASRGARHSIDAGVALDDYLCGRPTFSDRLPLSDMIALLWEVWVRARILCFSFSCVF